jgi:HSP20 family protein
MPAPRAEAVSATPASAAGAASHPSASSPSVQNPASNNAPVDEAIAGVERLYRVVTGRTPPSSDEPYSPIPVERDPADVVAERVDRLLDALGGATETPTLRWSPPMTVWEDERGLLVCLDVAGVSRRDLEVSLEGEVLTVSGRRASTREAMRLRGSERPLGQFVRQIVLPRTPPAAELSAQLRDGVLEILVPQRSAGHGAGPRPIAVV